MPSTARAEARGSVELSGNYVFHPASDTDFADIGDTTDAHRRDGYH